MDKIIMEQEEEQYSQHYNGLGLEASSDIATTFAFFLRVRLPLVLVL